MCGLAGFYNLTQENFSANPNHLEAMQKTIAHRGPNGYRCWISPDEQLGVTHRRLSILDLSDAGTQPMFDQDNTLMVMCNGEIYNHPELRKELEALGHRYRSNSDTETILYAYKQWGIDCLKKFDGMFAIVIYDMLSQELYLVRDHMGIKPLYFSVQSGVLSFASEIKALWKLPWNCKSYNMQALYHYLTYMVTPAPLTLYENVNKVPAGHYVRIDRHKSMHFVEWYNPLIGAWKLNLDGMSEMQHIKNIRSMLRDSIKKYMLSDVEYGVFLSGGIDSSLNVALMSEFTEQVKTFNVSFADGPEYSETMWARKIARKFNTDHHEIIIAEKEAFDFFERMVYHQDEPIADCVCIPLYYVSKLLKDSGVTVVQVGEGSDELFCGYSTYAQYLNLYNSYWKRSQKYIPAFAKHGIHTIIKPLLKNRPNRADIIKNWADNKHLFWSGAIAFTETWKHKITHMPSFTPDSATSAIYPHLKQGFNSYSFVDYHLDELYRHYPQADFLQSMIYLELKQRLPELLLMRVDKMAMAAGVEGRVPFLDHHFVEYAFALPSTLKYKNGITKYILKKAAEGILPHEVIYRKKMGFAAPTTRWFKEGTYFKPYLRDLLASTSHPLRDVLNFDALQTMFEKNKSPHVNNSLQLWVIQNLLAVEYYG